MAGVIISILSFLLVIGILVIVHELGHFLTAKKFGVGVEEFAFGIPPRIVAWEKNGTSYAINAIPIGGYVKLEGENGEEEVSRSPSSFQNKPPWQRFVILGAGSVVHLVLAVLIFWALIASQGKSVPTNTVQIVGVAKDSPAAEARIQADDQVVAVDHEPVTDITQFLS